MTVAYHQYESDSTTRISYNDEAIYIYLHRDEIFPAVLPHTVTVREDPLINVDIVSGTVVGIEIWLPKLPEGAS